MIIAPFLKNQDNFFLCLNSFFFSCKLCITAPAHQRATRVAVNPVLFYVNPTIPVPRLYRLRDSPNVILYSVLYES